MSPPGCTRLPHAAMMKWMRLARFELAISRLSDERLDQTGPQVRFVEWVWQDSNPRKSRIKSPVPNLACLQTHCGTETWSKVYFLIAFTLVSSGGMGAIDYYPTAFATSRSRYFSFILFHRCTPLNVSGHEEIQTPDILVRSQVPCPLGYVPTSLTGRVRTCVWRSTASR